MTGKELIDLFEQALRRHCLIGSTENGVIAGLDLEGRLFAIKNGLVVNRVNPAAILGMSSRSAYLNPGGDGLWPAPEGTCLGYEYPTGSWRVPPGITGAKYAVTEQKENFAKIAAEIDLVNDMGLGIPTIFERAISVSQEKSSIKVSVVESIQYIGSKTLEREQCIIAPWTLCQFDSGPGAEVVFPETDDSNVWDLYESSTEKRYRKSGLWHTRTDGGMKYQIGIGEAVKWIEFRNPAKDLVVKRTAADLPKGQRYIDIIDAPPDVKPSHKATKFSVYSDPSLFMEIEAVGSCPDLITPGSVMSLKVETTYGNLK